VRFVRALSNRSAALFARCIERRDKSASHKSRANLRARRICAHIRSHNAFLAGAWRGPSADLNNVVVFHERNRAVARYTRFGPARQSTARRGGRRLETYYVNVFFIEELRPDTARPCFRPCRDIANKFSFHRAFAGLHPRSRRKRKETDAERKVSFIPHYPECRLL